MSKIERFQGDVKAFASNAQGLERTVFGETTQANDLTSQVTAAFLRGWGIVGPSEHPSIEDFNAAMYAMSQFIAYQHQVGVPEWHAAQEYHTGSVCTHGGVSYQSLGDENIGNEPPSAKWTPVLTAKNGGNYFQPKNGNLTALAALVGSANKLPYFTGAGAMANTDLTAAGRGLISQADVAAILTYLGLSGGPFVSAEGGIYNNNFSFKIVTAEEIAVASGGVTHFSAKTDGDAVARIDVRAGRNVIATNGVFEVEPDGINYTRVYSAHNPPPNVVSGASWSSVTEMAFYNGQGFPKPTDSLAVFNIRFVGGGTNDGFIHCRYLQVYINGNWVIVN